jgi:hypothetical protein
MRQLADGALNREWLLESCTGNAGSQKVDQSVLRPF